MDGTEIVLNSAEPLLRGEEVALELRWEAVTDTGDEESEIWESPFQVRASRSGVFVLDMMAERVHVRDTDTGESRGSVSRSGDGPGEVRRPFGLAAQESGLVVGNGGRGTLEWFSNSGAWERSLQLDATGFALHGLGNDRFLVSFFRPGQAGWWVIEADGGMRSIEWPSWLHAPEPDEPCFRHASSGNSLLRISCHRPVLQVVDDAGRSIREIVIDRDAEQVDEARIEQAVERNASVMQADGLPDGVIEEIARQMREEYRLSQRWRGTRLDPVSGLGIMWEQEAEELGGGPATLHLLSSSGIFLASIRTAESWVDFDFLDGTIYALVEAEITGIVGLKAYRLEVPEEYTREQP